ncbi:E3 ubiquitin/ISG15 ligase TRIM25-like isoform X2 [Sylvia atricapilla]|uniref:E3 ubiquitin/ISG15 ligase TRIM25-like isoform X2 n=1 Tax=Sylvia atricapilla TaxID=48155 RepID=UPI00339A084B
MAKAGEGLEAELTCPVCLGLYQQPVSLSCGHNFCRRCIEEVLGAQQRNPRGPSTCPICRAYLGPTAELQNNFKLSGILEAFQAIASKGQRAGRESLEREETGVVPCEHCLDGSQPAVKTCLVCEASMCQAHLSKHNAKGFHQEHVLVEVGAGRAEERRCAHHGKLLECYCPREDMCVCILCSIDGAHKGHEVITMKEGHDRQLVKLADTMRELQKFKSDLAAVLEELQERENQVKISTKTLISKLFNELFNDIETELQEKKTMILSDILSKEEENLAVIANSRNKMEQKRDQAEENLQALQRIKEQSDVFLFFKDLKLVTDRIGSLDLDTESVDVKEVKLDWRMISQYKRLEKQLLSQLNSLLQDVREKLTNLNEAEQEKFQGDLSRVSGLRLSFTLKEGSQIYSHLLFCH